MITASICIGYGLLIVSEILPLIHGAPNGMLHSVLVLIHSIGDRIVHHPPTDVQDYLEDIEEGLEEGESLLEQLPVSSSSSFKS